MPIPKRETNKSNSIIEFFRGTAQIPIEIYSFDPSSPQYDITIWFPKEICFQVFSQLSSFDICSLSRVNKQWKSYLEKNILWEPLFKKEMWNIHSKSSTLQDTFWKSEYRTKKLILRNWKENKYSSKTRLVGPMRPIQISILETGKHAFLISNHQLFLLYIPDLSLFKVHEGLISKFFWMEKTSTLVFLDVHRTVFVLSVTMERKSYKVLNKIQKKYSPQVRDIGVTSDKILLLHHRVLSIYNLSLEVEKEIPIPAEVLPSELYLRNNENFVIIEANFTSAFKIVIFKIPKNIKDEVSPIIKHIAWMDFLMSSRRLITENYYSIVEGMFQTITSIELSTGKISQNSTYGRIVSIFSDKGPDILLMFDLEGNIVPKQLPSGKEVEGFRNFTPSISKVPHISEITVRGRMVAFTYNRISSLDVFDVLTGVNLLQINQYCPWVAMTDEYLLSIEGSNLVVRDFTDIIAEIEEIPVPKKKQKVILLDDV